MDIDTLHEFGIDFEHLSHLAPDANIQTKNWLLQLFDRLDSLDSQKASLLGHTHSMDNQGVVEEIEKKIVSTNETINTIFEKEGVRFNKDQFSEFADFDPLEYLRQLRRGAKKKPYHERLDDLHPSERKIAKELMRKEGLRGEKLEVAVRAELLERGRARQTKQSRSQIRRGGRQGEEAHHDFLIEPKGPPTTIRDRGALTRLKTSLLKDLKSIRRKAQVLTGRSIVDKRTKRGKLSAAIEPEEHVVGGILREIDGIWYKYMKDVEPLDGWLNKNPTKEHHAVMDDINSVLKTDKQLPASRIQYAEGLYNFAAFFPERQDDNWVVAFDVGNNEVMTRIYPLESFPSIQSVTDQIKMTIPEEWEVINIGEPFVLDRVREELEGEGFSPISTMKNLWRTFTDNLHNFASGIGPEGGLERLRRRGFGKDTEGGSKRLSDKSNARNIAENDLTKWSHNNPVEVKTHIERAKRDMQTVFSTSPLTVGKMLDALQQAKTQTDHSAAGLDGSTELAQMGIIETNWQNSNVVVSEGHLQYANSLIKDASDSINDLIKTIRDYSIIQGNTIADDGIRRILKTFAREARNHVPKMLEKPRKMFFTEKSDDLHEFASIANFIDEHIRALKDLAVEIGRKREELEDQLFEPNSFRTYRTRILENQDLYNHIIELAEPILQRLQGIDSSMNDKFVQVLTRAGIDEDFLSKEDRNKVTQAQNDLDEELNDYETLIEDEKWNEELTFAEMRDLDVQVKRTRDPYSTGDIHVEMRVIDPLGDEISSGQGYIDARTPNILDVEFVSSLGMSAREWMLQIVPKLRDALGVNRIQGYRATGAKLQGKDSVQVIEFTDMTPDQEHKGVNA